MINDKQTKSIRIASGVRQGDPLPPYLYIMSMEIYTHYLQTGPGLKGIKVDNEKHRLSQAADDTVFLFIDQQDLDIITFSLTVLEDTTMDEQTKAERTTPRKKQKQSNGKVKVKMEDGKMEVDEAEQGENLS